MERLTKGLFQHAVMVTEPTTPLNNADQGGTFYLAGIFITLSVILKIIKHKGTVTLCCSDMELSCDERVLKEINDDIKKPYVMSLLSLATRKHILNGSPLAFGEGNLKGRIKNVLNYKRPKFWVVVFSIVLVIIGGIVVMANPKTVETIGGALYSPLTNLEKIFVYDSIKTGG